MTTETKTATTVYAVTHIEKEVEVDDFEEGLAGSRTCTMSQAVNHVAATLPELLKKVGDIYGLAIDDVFIPGEEDEPVTWFGYNRLEDADCDEPDEHQMARWRRGKCRLWLADYSFCVERRTILPVAAADFAAAGIKTH